MKQLELTDMGRYAFGNEMKYADYKIRRNGDTWGVYFGRPAAVWSSGILATFEGTFIEASYALKLHLLTQRLTK